MKISAMRFADKWLGVPLCAAATLLEKPMWWRRKHTNNALTGAGGKLLVIKLSELGANVMLGATAARLRENFPRENTLWLAFAESREILRVMDFVPRENLLLVRTSSAAAFALDIFRALRRCRRERVDAALDLEFFSRAGALLAWLSGARRRCGVHAWFGEGAWRGGLLTHRVKFNPHLHISAMFESLAAALSLPARELQRIGFSPPAPAAVRERFSPADDERAAVEKLLRGLGWRGDGDVAGAAAEKIILLNANTSDREVVPLRRWDEKNYAALAALLLAEFPRALVLLTGAGKEAAGVARLEKMVASPRCRSIAGRTSFRELLTLYTRASLLVTNDSGPAHFAALTPVPVVVLFGPETPQLWRPLGARVRVVTRGLACSPCFSICNGRQSGCRKNACMDMTPAEVLTAAREFLPPC
jgi:ADP-heptose:LPS heptosyltransferase